MVNSYARLDRTFAALADPTRRAIVERLAVAEATVGDLAEPFRMSLPAVSKHIRVLEQAGLVHRERLGRAQVCRLVGAPLDDANRWIDRHRRLWERQLDGLQAYLERVTREGGA